MEEAIKNGFLCKYKYDPYFVTFTDEEWMEYLELTKKIPIAKDKINTTAALKRQLLKDQAENKNNAVIEIVQKLILSNSFKNTLIYCPKGIDDINDERYINKLKIRLKTNFPQLNIETFVSETADRDLLLNDFESEDVHMLLAIKCLDEGVNIPKTMNAIFVASGQNYREFVQRRGRVLRNYTDGDFKKEFASIFDIVILPTISQFTNHKNTAQKLIISEFARLYEFNDLAIPSLPTLQKITSNLENYGLTEGFIRQMVENNELNKI
jgi:superfamily II DNA or RNA helicase